MNALTLTPGSLSLKQLRSVWRQPVNVSLDERAHDAINNSVACVEAIEPELLQWLRAQNIRVLEVPYVDAMDLGCNVVALGDERVLVPASSRRLIEMCRAEGLEVYDPDVSMISAGGGAVHCMCQALHRESVAPGGGRR